MLEGGGFLARVDVCTGRWRAMRAPLADLNGARVVQTLDGALVLTASGAFVIRRETASLVRDLVATSNAHVAVAGAEVAVLVGDTLTVLDIRTRRARRAPTPPPPVPTYAAVLAIDSAQVFVVVPGEHAMRLDRRSATWTELPVPPAAADARIELVGGALLLLGTVDRRTNTLGAFELAPGAAAWQPRPFTGMDAVGRVMSTATESDRLVVWIARGSTRHRVVFATASHAWSSLDGEFIGGREVGDGLVVVGAQRPAAPGPGRYAIVRADTASQPRWVTVPAELGALAGTTTNDYGSLTLAAGAGRVLAVRAPTDTPTGWRDDPSSCAGPREAGAPGCDPVSVPTDVAHTAGRSFVFPMP